MNWLYDRYYLTWYSRVNEWNEREAYELEVKIQLKTQDSFEFTVFEIGERKAKR